MQNTITLKGTPFDLYMGVIPYMDLPSEILISDGSGTAQQILVVKSYGYNLLLDLAEGDYVLEITFTEDVSDRNGTVIDMREILGFDTETWDQYIYHLLFNNTGTRINFYYNKIANRVRELLHTDITMEKVIWSIICLEILDANYYDATSIKQLLSDKLLDSDMTYNDAYNMLRARYNILIAAMDNVQGGDDEHTSDANQ